jgi:hypothetical protein
LLPLDQEALHIMALGSDYSVQTHSHPGSTNLTDTVVDTLVRWPMRVTEATMDFMLQGVQRMTGTPHTNGDGGSTFESTSATSKTGASSGSVWTSMVSGAASALIDQDLGGDDLKYVIWSIVFTKPGFECILQKQQEELVNYPANSNTYAATKIAQHLDSARHGHVEKPAEWANRYPVDAPQTKTGRDVKTSAASTEAASASQETGWRVPPADQKYVVFLYKIDRRLPRQHDVRRIEHITVERDTRVV